VTANATSVDLAFLSWNVHLKISSLSVDCTTLQTSDKLFDQLLIVQRHDHLKYPLRIVPHSTEARRFFVSMMTEHEFNNKSRFSRIKMKRVRSIISFSVSLSSTLAIIFLRAASSLDATISLRSTFRWVVSVECTYRSPQSALIVPTRWSVW